MTDHLTADLTALHIDRDALPPSARGLRPLTAGLAVAIALVLVAARIGVPWVETRWMKTEVSVTEVVAVSLAQSQVQLTSTGYVVPQVQVDVSSKLIGRIKRARVREGSTVKQGEAIFELDATDQRVLVATAQARVESARARVAQARAQLAEVVQQRDREQRLARDGAVATATADDLSARARSVEAQVRAADADVAAAQAEVNALATNLTNTIIRSPIDGTILTKPLLPGDVVSPGVPMARIADFSSIVVETDVPEARLHLVRKGGPTEIVLDAYPDRHWRGEVIEVSPSLNRAKATATAKVRFLDRDDAVLPEMAARVSFLDGPLDARSLKEAPRKIIPASAVADRAGAKVVFALEGEKVRMVPVRVGAALAGGLELLDGPSAGTRIVSDPPPTLGDGQHINERSP